MWENAFLSWWRHQMETASALLAICAGNSPVPGEFPTQRPVRGALMFSLICVWINCWVNLREVGDFRRYPTNYDVIVMMHAISSPLCSQNMETLCTVLSSSEGKQPVDVPHKSLVCFLGFNPKKLLKQKKNTPFVDDLRHPKRFNDLRQIGAHMVYP